MLRLKDVLTGPCHVIQVLTGREMIVKSELERVFQMASRQEQIVILVPLLEKIVLRDRYRHEVIRERLFPGYLFLFGALDDMIYHKIIRNRRVSQFLKVGDTLYALPEKEWHLIGELCNGEGVVELSEVDFDENDRIFVISGAMKNLAGKVVKVNKRKRFAVVEMTFMGQAIRMQFHFTMLQKI